VSNDRAARLREILIPTRVVEMEMRVEHEAHRTIRDLADGGLNLFGERRELVVDQHRSIRTHQQAHVAARSREHVQVIGQLFGFDLDLAVILLLSRRACADQAGGDHRREQVPREQIASFHA
jgi:hypothetical protein